MSHWSREHRYTRTAPAFILHLGSLVDDVFVLVFPAVRNKNEDRDERNSVHDLQLCSADPTRE